MTAMTDEKRVSDRLYVFAKILANNEWTAALLGAYNPDGSIEVPYEAAKAALVADLTALSRRSQEPDGWRPIETAPKDGSEFIGGRWWQGRFLQDVLKFHPQDGKLRLIHSRYRHRMDADFWRPLPAAPIPQSNEAK